MKIVAVSACPTGVAHTYMAQEAIEKECKKRGYEVKVETQGSMGIENELTAEEVDNADVAILAVSIEIDEPERFDEKENIGRVLTVDPGEMIKHPEDILNKVEKLNEKG